MRVLVTGGAGFIGSNIVDVLLEQGMTVAVADDLSSGKSANVNPDARLYRVDICRPEFEEAFEDFGPEAVIHQAAQVGVHSSTLDPERDARINILGTIRVIELCARFGARKLVYASSAAVYGEPVGLPIDESHPVRPMAPYGISKFAGEQYVRIQSGLRGVSFTVLRYANVYGPRQGAAGEGGVVAIFADRLLSGLPPLIFGDGRQTRDFVYVGDVARANFLALQKGDGETVNVSCGTEISVNELFELARDAAGSGATPIYQAGRPGEIQRSVLDNNRAKRVLGWSPVTSLSCGIELTLGYWRGLEKRHA
ncbi:MAG: NAD-dependent epimerase/dehydratase family protein [Firmicutes bacterium]|nr:NAD-dependent epimerase/dehydratase family protein [Bacillota bacterium]